MLKNCPKKSSFDTEQKETTVQTGFTVFRFSVLLENVITHRNRLFSSAAQQTLIINAENEFFSFFDILAVAVSDAQAKENEEEKWHRFSAI